MPMKQRSPAELLDKLRSGKWRAREFGAFQRTFGDEALFGVLIQPFYSSSPADTLMVQNRAGQLLHELAPTCPSDLADIIRRALAGWNASAEELPFYLIDRFGPDAFEQAVVLVGGEVTADPELTLQIKRFQYWATGWRWRSTQATPPG